MRSVQKLGYAVAVIVAATSLAGCSPAFTIPDGHSAVAEFDCGGGDHVSLNMSSWTDTRGEFGPRSFPGYALFYNKAGGDRYRREPDVGHTSR